jgi:very-short-patch-repair endonuclease
MVKHFLFKYLLLVMIRNIPKKLGKKKYKLKNRGRRKKFDINAKSKLEAKFEEFLKELGLVLNVDYEFQYKITSAYFDFLIKGKRILIEVDGDFHHCNPNSIHKDPKYPIQIKSVKNDIRKNGIAVDNGYKLLRFWEMDINENTEVVKDILKKELLL